MSDHASDHGHDSAHAGRVAGRSVRRADAIEKVTGSAIYTVDVGLRESLHGVVVRSERAHAIIREIDRIEALAMPGVTAVITSEDLGGLFPRFGHIIADHPILAIERVRYWGEPVALVVAETYDLAADAAAAVVVRYEDLPPVMDVAAALAVDAPSLHEDEYEHGDESFRTLSGGGGEDGDLHPNVCHVSRIGWGDVDAALAQAHLVVENEAHYPMLYAYAMEPYNAVAQFNDEGLDVTTTAQHPYQVREDLARIFSLPYSRVRVRVPYIGGGYGSKSYTKVEPLAAIGAWVTRRPVKVVLTIEESIYTTRVDSAVVKIRSGFDAEGRFLARDIEITMDSGAYADNSPLVLGKAVNRSFGPYKVPNLRVVGRSIYTNTSPASSYRGFGAPHGNLAAEVNLDRAAEQLGIDPLEMRRRNLVGPGEELLPGKRGLDADIAADLDMVVAKLQEGILDAPDDGKLRGSGFGCAASDAGAFPISTASVRALCDGSIMVLSGSTEMGQGSRTALGQIAAELLGVPMDRVRVIQSDTSTTPYERTSGASRTTTLAGLAIQKACADLRRRAREMAAEFSKVALEDVADADGGVALPDGTLLDFETVIIRWFGSRAGEITGIGLVRKGDETAKMPPFWEIGAVGVTVAIDPETGHVAIEHLVTVGDVGFAINPAAVHGQDLGAATQGLGAALFEELVYDGPHPLNPNVVDYRVPKVHDTPHRIDTLLAERRDGIGPFGAKGSGEGALNPVAGAVASAIARATGKWPTVAPMTPERVWKLLQS